MADIATKQTPESPLNNVSNIINSLAPIFLGSGKTTQGENTSSSASAGIPELQQLLAQLNSQAGDTSLTDNLVSNIMTKAAQAFAPTMGQQSGAGLYNSTVLRQMSNEAKARATAEASAAVLDFRTNSQKIATAAAGNLTAATKTTTSTGTKQTAPIISPSSLLPGLLLMAGKSALGKTDIMDSIFGAKKKVPGSSLASEYRADMPGGDTSAVTGNAGSSAGADVASATSGPTDAALDTAVSTPLSEGGVNAATLLGADEGISALSTAGVEVGSEVGATTAGIDAVATTGAVDEGILGSGIGAGFESGGLDIVGEVAGGAVADAAGAGLLEEAAPLALAAWIVCTELNAQGRMPHRWYRYGARIFLEHSKHPHAEYLVGYYIWAIPLVRHLRKHPTSVLSKITEYVFNRRAEYLAATAGCKSARKTLIGGAITKVTYAFCYSLGAFLYHTNIKKAINWETV